MQAMVAMGDLYYYGARGLGRDQARARELFLRAGAAGHVLGQRGAANMLLKGEGGPKNVSHAIGLYERAAAQNDTAALNGLGFIYYTGDVVPRNASLAFRYFNDAASGPDPGGDSLFNLGFCYNAGVGTEENATRARDIFTQVSLHYPSVNANTHHSTARL